jgi:hypothetical protein
MKMHQAMTAPKHAPKQTVAPSCSRSVDTASVVGELPASPVHKALDAQRAVPNEFSPPALSPLPAEVSS